MFCRLPMSAFFSTISMEREPTTLKTAISKIKARMRKVTHFSIWSIR